MNKNNPKILVILGPTSSGKSDVAIKLAKKHNGEIISADSRQVYRGLDIGTGKVYGTWSMKHRAFISENITHHLIDIASPKTEYNVSKFKKDAEKVIKAILKRGKFPIICGGTGFWIKAIVDNVNLPEVKPNKELRKGLEKESIKKLFAMLNKLDPERAKNIDAKNKVRLIRAIEICKAIGQVPKIMKHGTWNMEHEFLQIGIDVSKEKLHEKIKKRLEERFRKGMIKEVEKLHNPPAGEGLSFPKIQSFGLGYYWIPLYLKKKISKDELFEKVYQAEKNYAKRQMTWFKKDKRIKWMKSYKEIKGEVKKFVL